MPWCEPHHEVVADHVRELTKIIRTIESGKTGEGVAELKRLAKAIRAAALKFEREAPFMARKPREELKA